MKKRLLHLVALDMIGGVEQLYAFFIEASQQHFDHVTVNDRKELSSSFKSRILNHSTYYSSKKWAGITLPKWPAIFRKSYLEKIIQREKPDLIVVWNKVDGFDIEGKELAIPVVYYEHGAGRDNNNPEKVKDFLAKVDAIIACSHSALEVLTKRWQLPSSNTMSVCYNPVLGIEEGLNCGSRVSTLGRPYVFGMACRMVANKGVPIALHAIVLLRQQGVDVQLKLAGVGPELKHYQQLVVDLGLSSVVKFLGLVDDMPDFYRMIDVCLCPSINEAFGLVAVEASLFSVPVVASRVGGLKEIVIEGENGV